MAPRTKLLAALSPALTVLVAVAGVVAWHSARGSPVTLVEVPPPCDELFLRAMQPPSRVAWWREVVGPAHRIWPDPPLDTVTSKHSACSALWSRMNALQDYIAHDQHERHRGEAGNK